MRSRLADVIPAKGDLCITTVIPVKTGIQGWRGGPPSYEFAYLLIHSDLGDEVDHGFAKVSEGGNPYVWVVAWLAAI